MNQLIRHICFTLFLFIIGCNLDDDNSNKDASSEGFTHLKYNFYRNTNGTLFEKKFEAIWDSKVEAFTFFDSTLYFPEWPETQLIDSIIDINSYEIVKNSGYSKDNNYVYYFRATSDGGQRHVVKNADPTTFMSLDYSWGRDRNNVFWKYMIVDSADVNSFEVSPITMDSAFDKNHQYIQGELIKQYIKSYNIPYF